MEVERHITPYNFEGIKKLTRRDLEIEEALWSYLPAARENLIKKALEAFLSKQFNTSCAISLEKIEEGHFSSFVKTLPELCFLAQLGVQPLTHKAFAWVDNVLSFSLIDRVLGGPGDFPKEMRGLTPIEEGVLQYLLLKTLHEIFQACQDLNPIHFRLESIFKTNKEIQSSMSEDNPMVLLHVRVKVGETMGFILLALPHPLIEETFLTRSPLDQAELENSYPSKIFEPLHHVKTSLWVDVGSVSLTMAEKNQLEKGDVILFDQSHCQMIDGHLSGNAIVRIGEGKGGGFLAQLLSAGAPALLKILDYYGGE